MSQDDLAAALDLTRGSISHWENGESSPRMKTLEKIASFFGVSPDILLRDGSISQSGNVVRLERFELTDAESELVRAYRSMNAEGREAALDSVLGLSMLPKYSNEVLKFKHVSVS